MGRTEIIRDCLQTTREIVPSIIQTPPDGTTLDTSGKGAIVKDRRGRTVAELLPATKTSGTRYTLYDRGWFNTIRISLTEPADDITQGDPPYRPVPDTHTPPYWAGGILSQPPGGYGGQLSALATNKLLSARQTRSKPDLVVTRNGRLLNFSRPVDQRTIERSLYRLYRLTPQR